jgi:transposase, IS6 family
MAVRHFQDQMIVLCVRWYLRYSLMLLDLEELMMERGLRVDHSTIARWVLRYAPELHKRVRREMRPPNRSWRVDETYVRVTGAWTYGFTGPLPKSGHYVGLETSLREAFRQNEIR